MVVDFQILGENDVYFNFYNLGSILSYSKSILLGERNMIKRVFKMERSQKNYLCLFIL